MSQELQLLIVCFCFLTLEEGVAEGLFRSLIPETSRKTGLSSPPTPVEMQIRPPQSFADLSAHAEAAEAVFLNVFVPGRKERFSREALCCKMATDL